MTGGVCRTCGAAVLPGDRFCGNCGASVPAPAETRSGTARRAEMSPPDPIAVAQMPTVPPPVGPPVATPDPRPGLFDHGNENATVQLTALDQNPPVGPPIDGQPQVRGGRKFRLLAGVGVVLLVAAIAALSLALISTRGDVDNERAKLAQAEAALAEATGNTTTAPDDGNVGNITPIDPNVDPTVDTVVDPTVEMQTQIDQLNAALAQARADLTSERQARADEAAAAQVALDQAAAAATEAQAAAAEAAATASSVQEQLDALGTVFPLTPASIMSVDPTGEYRAVLTPRECDLELCSTAAPLAITFVDAATVSGDRTNGPLAFDGTNYTNSGPVELAKSPQCATVDQDSTYAFDAHVTEVSLVDGALRATKMAGTYTETITGGACAGKHRSFSLAMERR